MFFDLSPEITLEEKSSSLYVKLRFFLYAFSFLIASYLAFRILFPSSFFEFSFLNPNSNNNNITDIHEDDLTPVEKGILPAGKNINFETSSSGIFSTAIVSFSLNEKSPNLSMQDLTVKKSYSAFLYPEGAAMGFRDGTLLTNANSYYIISRGELRKFANQEIASSLGFPKDGFIAANANDLALNPNGDDIAKNSGYPDYSIFHIQDNYYLLQDNKLKRFSSDSAFSTFYRPSQAIEKDADFLQKYELDSNMIGFSDGSLISYADSIFIIDGDKMLPVNNPVTFVSKGFNWSDVIQASADEIALYTKDKLFTISKDHPNGTIFAITENQKHYLIQNNWKHLLPSENILASWKNITPIQVSLDSLNITGNCQLQKSPTDPYVFSCEMPITQLQGLTGTDYVFFLEQDRDTKLDLMNIEFKKNVNMTNFKSTIITLLSRIRANYVK